MIDNLLEFIGSLKAGDHVEYREPRETNYNRYVVVANHTVSGSVFYDRRPIVDLTLDSDSSSRGFRIICFSPGVPFYCGVDIRPVVEPYAA